MDYAPSSERLKLFNELTAAIREEMRLAIAWNDAAATFAGLYPTDAVILFFLYENRSATASQVGKIAGLTTGATTAALIRLEKSGFISRVRDPSDKRRVIISTRQLPKEFQTIRELSETELQNILKDTSTTAIQNLIEHRQQINTMLTHIIGELAATPSP